MPSLVITVPALVLFKGGDALSVCLNTVAILFLCDIDNIFFDLVLGERVPARVEDAGRVELDDAEASALARTKAVHVALLVLAVLGVVWSGDLGGGEVALLLPSPCHPFRILCRGSWRLVVVVMMSALLVVAVGSGSQQSRRRPRMDHMLSRCTSPRNTCRVVQAIARTSKHNKKDQKGS